MKCLICNLEYKSLHALCTHARRSHSISSHDYKEKFGLLKLCKKCNKEISKRGSKSGFCNRCRDRTSENNSFYGKKHNCDTIKRIKEKNSIISKKLWESSSYRDKVVKNATGKKRDSKFSKTQKVNAIRQFLDSSQRNLRSKIMKKTWEDGKIVQNHITESKIEKMFFDDVSEISPFSVVKKALHFKNRTITPDVLIRNIVFEFYGDYWHRNPKIYKENQVIDNRSSKDIWEHDKNRIQVLEDNGYVVYIIWEHDYRNNKELVLNNIDRILNWECLG